MVSSFFSDSFQMNETLNRLHKVDPKQLFQKKNKENSRTFSPDSIQRCAASRPPCQMRCSGDVIVESPCSQCFHCYEEMQPVPEYKVIVVGPSNAGKTSLIKRLDPNSVSSFSSHSSVNQCPKATIGVECISMSLHSQGKETKLCLWDIAGHDRFACMMRVFYVHAVVAIVVFDVSDPSSLERSKTWIEHVQDKVRQDDGSPIPVFLWGNKTDLNNVSGRPSKDFLERFDIKEYFEVSAKSLDDNEVWRGLHSVVSVIHSEKERLHEIRHQHQYALNPDNQGVSPPIILSGGGHDGDGRCNQSSAPHFSCCGV